MPDREQNTKNNKRNEIAGVILLGVAALCAVAVYFGGDSIFATLVRQFIFGSTGVLGYIVPVLLVVLGVLVIAARQRTVNYGKLSLVLLCVLFIFSAVHLSVVESITVPGQTYGAFLADSYGVGIADATGGGVLGGLLTYWSYYFLGFAGSWIVCLVGIASCVLGLTNLSIKRISSDLGGAVKSGLEAYKAHADGRREAQEMYVEKLGRQPSGSRPSRNRSGGNPFDLKIQAREPKRRIGGRKKAEREPALEPAFQIFKRDENQTDNNVIDIRTHAPRAVGADTSIPVFEQAPDYDPEPYREVFADTDIEFQDTPVIELRSRRRIDPALAGEDAQVPPSSLSGLAELAVEPSGGTSDVAGNEIQTAQSAAGEPEEDALPWEEPFRAFTMPPGAADAESSNPDRLPVGGASRSYHVEREQNREGTAAVVAADTGSSTAAQTGPENFSLPPLELLERQALKTQDKEEDLQLNAARLENMLQSFRIDAQVVNILQGPVVTRYELKLAPGIPVKRVEGLASDIAMNLEASSIRIEAPVPGKAVVGVEVPNHHREMVGLRELLEDPRYAKVTSPIAFALGKDITGTPVYADIAKMPHLLVAGQTGSGKSVCLNSLIISILYRATPEDVKMLMIDPKQVELSGYNSIPHLIAPVVTDSKKAPLALNWAVNEMNQRYRMFQKKEKRDLKSYNAAIQAEGAQKLPQILVIVDELAELMLSNARKEVEEAIQRIAQLGRAAGIHLVIATQRPIVDVISGLIKANVPGRIAFSVKSAMDSRTILDIGGAESLLGKGDMLFYTTGLSNPERIQGCHVSDPEIERVVSFLRASVPDSLSPRVDFEEGTSAGTDSVESEDRDPLFVEAVRLAVGNEGVSTSFLQRRLKIGYGRAARLVDQMEQEGIVSGQNGSKAREILITREDYDRLYGEEGM